MNNRPTLEEQLLRAKIRAKRNYVGKMLRAIGGKRTPELYNELFDDSIFVIRDAEKLFAEITMNEDNGHPIPKKYIRKPENVSAFAYLVSLDLIEIQKHPYLSIFKREVVVSKRKT